MSLTVDDLPSPPKKTVTIDDLPTPDWFDRNLIEPFKRNVDSVIGSDARSFIGSTGAEVINTPNRVSNGVVKMVGGGLQTLGKPLGFNIGDDVVNYANRQTQKMDAQTNEVGKYTGMGKDLAGQVGLFLTPAGRAIGGQGLATQAGSVISQLPAGGRVLSQALKMKQAIPSATLANLPQKIIGGGIVGGSTALLTPTKTGLDIEDFKEQKREDVRTGAMFGSALPVVGMVGKGITDRVLPFIGGVTSFTPPKVFEKVVQDGYKSTSGNSKNFLEFLRGNLSMRDLANQGKSAVRQVDQNAKNKYEIDLRTIDDSKLLPANEVLDLSKSLNDLVSSYRSHSPIVGGGSFVKGSNKTIDKVGSLANEVNIFLNNPQFHNARQINDLRQKVNDMMPKNPSPNLKRAFETVADKLNQKANLLDPKVSIMNQAYAESRQTLKDVKQTLGLSPFGDDMNNVMALRKLLQTQRSNVNSNFDYNRQVLDELNTKLGAGVRGASLHNLLPHGLGKVVMGAQGGLLGVNALQTGNPALLPLLALSSPRLVAEALYKTGQAQKALQDGSLIKRSLFNDYYSTNKEE